ncbi:MAG: hypothetical protein L3J33_09960 [Rhodobacteraceae bacterium]|nr:hypothetical protein [Paracoccaceae bacterium]
MKLLFKSSEAFLEYCNSQFAAKPRKGEGRPAIILKSGLKKIENHAPRTDDKRYRLKLLVCGAPEGFFTFSETLNPSQGSLEEGNLVIWEAFEKPFFSKAKIGRFTGDRRSNWIGFVVAKIAPEFDSKTGKFTVLSRFD